ncbi:hypothetical protein NKR23_g7571 [Pleurostoma richardsiae]|uniref:Uncharacterized protein n=1 Tax=Pleurostoma richardsiae TaxID=41990 RepID=A0AA38VMJ3_9PEZI|nr:hypothetical protein NKR23_g7571 [Pleurostoma richardsiae]
MAAYDADSNSHWPEATSVGDLENSMNGLNIAGTSSTPTPDQTAAYFYPDQAGSYAYDEYPAGSSYTSEGTSPLSPASGWSSSPTDGLSMAQSFTTVGSADSNYTFASQVETRPGQPSSHRWLPCEFHYLKRCNVRFSAEDVERWIEHIAGHMHHRFPEHTMCWFCDDFEFPASEFLGDTRDAFSKRMCHIRDHLVEEGRKVTDIRPDFPLLKHLYEQGIVTEEEYQYYTSFTENPFAFPAAEDEGGSGSEAGPAIAEVSSRRDREKRRKGKEAQRPRPDGHKYHSHTKKEKEHHKGRKSGK